MEEGEGEDGDGGRVTSAFILLLRSSQ